MKKKGRRKEGRKEGKKKPTWLGSSLVTQWVKDPVLLQLWQRWQLQLGFDPWPGNFHTLWVQLEKKKKKERKKDTDSRQNSVSLSEARKYQAHKRLGYFFFFLIFYYS